MSEPRTGPQIALRSGTGIAPIAATVLVSMVASMVACIDANVIKVAIPAIGLFVTDRRAAAARLARWAPHHGCAVPVPDLVGTP